MDLPRRKSPHQLESTTSLPERDHGSSCLRCWATTLASVAPSSVKREDDEIGRSCPSVRGASDHLRRNFLSIHRNRSQLPLKLFRLAGARAPGQLLPSLSSSNFPNSQVSSRTCTCALVDAPGMAEMVTTGLIHGRSWMRILGGSAENRLHLEQATRMNLILDACAPQKPAIACDESLSFAHEHDVLEYPNSVRMPMWGCSCLSPLTIRYILLVVLVRILRVTTT